MRMGQLSIYFSYLGLMDCHPQLHMMIYLKATVHNANSVADLGFLKGVSEIIMEINVKKSSAENFDILESFEVLEDFRLP